MPVFYANKITLQVAEAARLIFEDQRQTRDGYERPDAGGVVSLGLQEVVLTIENARALRDLMVQYVKDEDFPPGSTSN